jgi:hypothetical protein
VLAPRYTQTGFMVSLKGRVRQSHKGLVPDVDVLSYSIVLM